jgi:hypothetical protein
MYLSPVPLSAHTRPAGNTNNYSASGTTPGGTPDGVPGQPGPLNDFSMAVVAVVLVPAAASVPVAPLVTRQALR